MRVGWLALWDISFIHLPDMGSKHAYIIEYLHPDKSRKPDTCVSLQYPIEFYEISRAVGILLKNSVRKQINAETPDVSTYRDRFS